MIVIFKRTRVRTELADITAVNNYLVANDDTVLTTEEISRLDSIGHVNKDKHLVRL